jgi:hypothetical protein
MEVSGQLHALVALTPGTELPVPLGEKAGWTSEPVRTLQRREISLLTKENIYQEKNVQAV